MDWYGHYFYWPPFGMENGKDPQGSVGHRLAEDSPLATLAG